ncbi:hypothetical protein L596_005667 [Steinernema carpocapsae]|uniref:Uncharacterized protein n=1 Tax=Steinernema carpocapsae TaxID=34508 RepID=A0A4U8V528_STECR|nr:hypothetical protein L596_005667 [Steinernema carpocapsae]
MVITNVKLALNYRRRLQISRWSRGRSLCSESDFPRSVVVTLEVSSEFAREAPEEQIEDPRRLRTRN